MTTSIPNNGLPKLQQASTAPAAQPADGTTRGGAAPPNKQVAAADGAPPNRQITADRGAPPNSQVAASDGAPPNKSGDQVQLTDSAQALRQAARVDKHSAIDSQRVDKVRASLANGSYQISPDKIADKLTALDQQLGGTGKA